MKRSEIYKALKELEAVCRRYHCYLPPFCHFTNEEWETKGHAEKLLYLKEGQYAPNHFHWYKTEDIVLAKM